MISLRHWTYIGLGVLLALAVIALLVTRASLNDCRRETAALNGKLAVSNASIGTLTAEIDRMRAEQVALANDDANRIAASRQAIEMARAAEKWREGVIANLEASAVAVKTENAVETCEASEAVKAVWQ